MKRKLKSTKVLEAFFLTFLILVAALVGPSLAKASVPKITNASFLSLPEEALVSDGYLNALNTGFRIYADLDASYQPDDLAIFLDSEIVPLDERTFDGGLSYYLSSNTKSLAELKTLLDYSNPGVSKMHQVFLKAQEVPGGIYETLWTYNFTADFDAPSGVIAYTTKFNKSKLALGDYVDFGFTPDVGVLDTKSVEFTFNGQDYSAIKNLDGTFSFNLPVTDKIADYNGGGQIAAKVADHAGNVFQTGIATKFTIDATAPSITIISPQNSNIYSPGNIQLNYTLDDETAQVVVRLNGQIISIKNGGMFQNLPDGDYSLEVEATDAAGNVTTAIAGFAVDQTPPVYSITNRSDGAVIESDGEVMIDGVTESGAKVTLEIPSENITMEIIADQFGNFRFEIPAGNLGAGDYEAYLTFADMLGNFTRFKVADFTILAPRKVVTFAFVENPPSALAIQSDVAASVISRTTSTEQPEKTEVAREGQISSAQDSKAGTNWGAWIILLAIVTLASAIATAGYYGFEWLGAKQSSQSTPQAPAASSEPAATQKPTEIKKSESKTDETESEERKARW